MKKPVRIFLKGQAKEAFLRLKKRNDKESRVILKSFNRVKEILKENPQFGDPISKDKIPHDFKKQEIKNLYRAELSNYWRMLYTLEGNVVEIFLFILNIVDRLCLELVSFDFNCFPLNSTIVETHPNHKKFLVLDKIVFCLKLARPKFFPTLLLQKFVKIKELQTEPVDHKDYNRVLGYK